MLDKTKPFQECLGQLVENVKFIQDGNAYSGNGTCLGKYTNNRLVSEEVKIAYFMGTGVQKYLDGGAQRDTQPETPPTPSAPANTDGIDEMDRPALLAYAFDKYQVKLKGNLSKEQLRDQIRGLEA